MPDLILYGTKDEPLQIWKLNSTVVVGRGTCCNIQIPNPTVSRKHFKLYIKDADSHVCRIENLSSVGTYLNDLINLRESIVVVEDTHIRAGRINFKLIFEEINNGGSDDTLST